MAQRLLGLGAVMLLSAPVSLAAEKLTLIHAGELLAVDFVMRSGKVYKQ